MTTIQLVNAARHFKDLPHQASAWDWLQKGLTAEQLEGFARMYRDGPPDPPPSTVPPSGGSAVELALPMIRYFESFSEIAYVDPLSGGEPITIGFGTTQFPCGRPVRMGDRVTPQQAEGYLRWYADRCEAVQRSRIPTWGQMLPQQQAALIGYAFNLGSAWFGSHGFATLTRVVRDADWNAVPAALLLYVNPGSSVEAGLRRRRQAEGQLWNTGWWDKG